MVFVCYLKMEGGNEGGGWKDGGWFFFVIKKV